MKRLLVIFALLACFALPAQLAAAYTFDPAKSLEQNLAALAQESGNNMVDMGSLAFNPAPGNYFNLVQIYLDRSLGVDVLGGQAQDLGGLSALMGLEYAGLTLNLEGGSSVGLDERNAVKWMFPVGGNTMLLDFEGSYINLTGGAIFCVDLDGNGSFMDAVYVLIRGQAPAVPVPAAALLLGTGLAGLLTLRRKQR